MALSIIFDLHRSEAGTLYFYDLVGAALGAVLVTCCCTCLAAKRHCWLVRLRGGRRTRSACRLLLSHEIQRVWQPLDFSGCGAARRPANGSGLLCGQFTGFRVKPGTTKAMRNQMDASPGSKFDRQDGTPTHASIAWKACRIVSRGSTSIPTPGPVSAAGMGSSTVCRTCADRIALIPADTKCRDDDHRTGAVRRRRRPCFRQRKVTAVR